MEAHVLMKCPYCGHENHAFVEFRGRMMYTKPQAVVCDSDEGGCDNYFVFEARASVTVITGTIGGNLQPELRNMAQEAR